MWNLQSEYSQFLNTIFTHLPPLATAARCDPHPLHCSCYATGFYCVLLVVFISVCFLASNFLVCISGWFTTAKCRLQCIFLTNAVLAGACVSIPALEIVRQVSRALEVRVALASKWASWHTQSESVIAKAETMMAEHDFNQSIDRSRSICTAPPVGRGRRWLTISWCKKTI